METDMDFIMKQFADDTETDVLLIQPSTLFRQQRVDDDVMTYFRISGEIGELKGDSPYEANYGLLSLATNINNLGININIIDLNYIDYKLRENGGILDEQKTEYILSKYYAKIIGISFMTATYGNWEKSLYKIIRGFKRNINIPIVYGGIHPTIFWKEILNNKQDPNFYIMTGEGDIEFPKFCQIMLERKVKNNKIYGMGNYSLVPKKQIVDARDLALMGLPNHSLLPKYYESDARRFYITRGCSGHCSFCSVSSFHASESGKYHRQLAHEEKDVIKFPQIDSIFKEYKKGNKIIIGDLTFFETEPYYKDFCEQLIEKSKRTGVFPKWWCQTRADSIKENIDIIRDAGCDQIAIGCETASNYLLKKMHKHITVRNWKEALYLAKEADISTQAYIIIGAGFEGQKSVEQTIETVVGLIENNHIDMVHLSILVPFPGTILSEKPEKHGIRIRHREYEKYWMNCDMYGYGLPVYDTIASDGKVLLTAEKIYEYWKTAMREIGNAHISRNNREREDRHNEICSFG